MPRSAILLVTICLSITACGDGGEPARGQLRADRHLAAQRLRHLSGRLGRPGGAPDLIRTKNLRSDALRLEEGGMVRDILKNLKGGAI